jgi:hypothetical protein
MRIDQRNAGASVATSSGSYVYTVDRWQVVYSQTSKFTAQQNAGSVTPPVGFSNYLGVTSSSAYTLTSTDSFQIQQYIEGYNIADLAWGTANARTITLSFWARSSLTGTFSGFLVNSAGTQVYPFGYTISTANTWQQISITIAGSTTGTWLTTNGTGLRVAFNLGQGSAYVGAGNAWNGGGTVYQVTGSNNIVSTNGATFYITGVQLEVGSTATPFERRMYGQEFAMCQRYYQVQAQLISYTISSTAVSAWGSLQATMRAVPTVGQTGVFNMQGGPDNVTQSSLSTGTNYCSEYSIYLYSIGGFSGLTTGRYNTISVTANNQNSFTFSAEL